MSEIVEAILDDALLNGVTLFAAAAMDVVVVLLNWRLAVDELIAMVKDADPIMLLSSASFQSVAKAMALEIDDLFIGLADDENLTHAVGGRIRWAPDVSGAARRQISPLGDLLLCYTSGSSGIPKGVRLTHANGSAACVQARSHTPWGWREGSVALCALPLFHIAG